VTASGRAHLCLPVAGSLSRLMPPLGRAGPEVLQGYELLAAVIGRRHDAFASAPAGAFIVS
jgi:hypothetical protein